MFTIKRQPKSVATCTVYLTLTSTHILLPGPEIEIYGPGVSHTPSLQVDSDPLTLSPRMPIPQSN